jgi:hypothetical protein
MASIEKRLEALEQGRPKLTTDSKGYPLPDLTGEALCDWVRNVMPGSESIAGELAAVYLEAAIAESDVINGSAMYGERIDRDVTDRCRRAGEIALRAREKELRRESRS